MRKWMCLTRVLLKTTLGSMNQAMTMTSKNKKKRNRAMGGKLLYLLLAVCLLPTIFMLGAAGYEGYGMLADVGQGGLIPSFICIMG